MKLHIQHTQSVIQVNHPVQVNRYPSAPVFRSHPPLPKAKVNETKKKN